MHQPNLSDAFAIRQVELLASKLASAPSLKMGVSSDWSLNGKQNSRQLGKGDVSIKIGGQGLWHLL